MIISHSHSGLPIIPQLVVVLSVVVLADNYNNKYVISNNCNTATAERPM